MFFFFFKQKTAYEMRISDWSSDVCSSDLVPCDMPHKLLINIWQRPELWKRYQSRAAAKQFGNGIRYRIQRFDKRNVGKGSQSIVRDGRRRRIMKPIDQQSGIAFP